MADQSKRIVHVVGTGTIGEPLIGLLADFREQLGIDEISFSKKQALLLDRSKVVSLTKRGAKLCADKEAWKDFEKIGIQPSYEIMEGLERASVVIDCTPSGKGRENKSQFYEKFNNACGFIAQGSEFGFGKMYATGINDKSLEPGKDRFIHVVSCNTHNLAVLLQTLGMGADGTNHVEEGRFVCIRRANDMSHDGSFVPSPKVDAHKDDTFGTHHARDAWHLFKTMDHDLNLYSSSLKISTQYMHTVWFHMRLNREITMDEVEGRLRENPRVALTYKTSANKVFSFGRDHGHYGRILSQTVVPLPALKVGPSRKEITGFCFTPQDGNALLSSVAATEFLFDPDNYEKKLECLTPYLFQEV